MQAIDLAILQVSLESPNSLNGFLRHSFTVFGIIIIFVGDSIKIKASIYTVIFLSTRSLF